ICARREERLLPASVVREEVDERAAAIEAAEGRNVGRKERNQIRDEVEMTLLPRAFTRSQHVFAYIDPAARWLIVDAASRKRAEEITVLLRESLGSFAVVPPVTEQPPLAVMTTWLLEGGTREFDLGDECELRDESDEGGVIRCRKLAIDDDEILAHVRAGKRVSRLAIHYGERLSCVLGDDLSIKRLKFLDMVQDAAAEVEAEGHAARMDADFVLMAAELAPFLDAVVAGFGGLQVETS
ncbi:MAG: recombination-associated protein RdgC, partial [Gammaproteobacteria bacterium]